MCWLRRLLLIAVLTVPVGLLPRAAEVYSQSVECVQTSTPPINIGTPGADGVTRQEKLAQAGDKIRYAFHVPSPSSAFIYVGDQWYDLDLALFTQGHCVAAWEVAAKGSSDKEGRRILQYQRPDEEILNLEPGDYLLIVGHKYAETPEFAAGFDPEKGFTVRIALNAPVCNLNPPNDQPTRFPGVSKRRDDAWYQLAMSFQPNSPGPFDLMTFNAMVSPPFLDLFDFAWQIDGMPVPDSNTPTIQMAVIALPKTPDGQHQVKVFAKGARVYPDPDQPHIPLDGGILSVSCTFKLQGA